MKIDLIKLLQIDLNNSNKIHKIKREEVNKQGINRFRK